MAAFTKDTSHPSNADAEFEYTDMRGRHWRVSESRADVRNWVASAKPDAAEAYELVPGRMFIAASDAEGLIDGIEEKLEAARAAGETPGQHFNEAPPSTSSFPWWLVALGVAAYYYDKQKRRRR